VSAEPAPFRRFAAMMRSTPAPSARPVPSRTTCVVVALPNPAMLIEIEAWRI